MIPAMKGERWGRSLSFFSSIIFNCTACVACASLIFVFQIIFPPPLSLSLSLSLRWSASLLPRHVSCSQPDTSLISVHLGAIVNSVLQLGAHDLSAGVGRQLNGEEASMSHR